MTGGAPRWPRLVAAAWVLVSGVLLLGSGAGAQQRSPGPGSPASAPDRPGSSGCLECHSGIEDMHPAARLGCVDCHGGDASARTKLEAHVPAPEHTRELDESVAPEDEALAWRRFRNPMDLRVADRVCGDCHRDLVHDLDLSLHGTTAGHLSDGFYEIGAHDEKGSRYSVFPARAEEDEQAGLERLVQVPAFRPRGEGGLAEHYHDLARKECMQCHLHSTGRAVRGRLGFDGEYRGEGCAACHVPYAPDGFSRTRDRTVSRTEPGHPLRHTMTRAPETEACTTCHYGDASIGLHFRGLSQLPPGAPGGPEIPGTTDALLNRVFYLNDNAIAPPDVHHEKGMHCIDCHTLSDVMGDGRMHGNMEHAVEISCEACHGTFDAPSDLRTERGAPLEHLFREGNEVFLRSKVDGRVHRITQVVDVLDPTHEDYEFEAARAMTSAHADVECYTCHAGWNVNFVGFHFYRNEALSQLDLLSGRRTPGRVTTQEKVFTTWKSFYAGLNESGRVAPYLTGFSTMGTVDDAEGRRILDQVMPETAAGLSGLTMIHHQLHSTRPTARSCVECHRSSATWGLGSGNFRLTRRLAFVADRRGIETVALQRGSLTASWPLAKVVLPDVVDLELLCDPLQGHAETLYATEGHRGLHVFDVRDPLRPERTAFLQTVNPRGLERMGSHLVLADGVGGLRVFDISDPRRPQEVGVLPLLDAHEVRIQWPYAYVADGPGGLAIVDLRAPTAPRLVAALDLVPGSREPDDIVDVDVLFQYSRPMVDGQGQPVDERESARMLVAALDSRTGLYLVDATEPSDPRLLSPRSDRRTVSVSRGGSAFLGLALASHVDLASPQGGARTVERDYAYLLEEVERGGRGRSILRVIDVSRPEEPVEAGRSGAGGTSESLVSTAIYNPPFVQRIMLVPGEEGVLALDASVSTEPEQVGGLAGLGLSYAVAVEEFPLDQMLEPDGRRLKDVSHEGSRWLHAAEVARVLAVSGERLGLIGAGHRPPRGPASSARVFLERLDADRDGLLTGEEYDRGGGKALDRDGDGRLTLGELARMGSDATRGQTGIQAAPDVLVIDERTRPGGDLARLFDGIDPGDFDRDDDRRLSREELRGALFAALDLDLSGRLDRGELSRHPGGLRELRFGDPAAEERFATSDRNGGGTVSPRELVVREMDWRALDSDGDGGVQLEVHLSRAELRGGAGPPPVEWPRNRDQVTGLPPDVTVEEVLAAFDRDGNGRLSLRELGSRRDLARELDRNEDGVVVPEELERAVARAVAGGVDAAPDGFQARWDLDGDGGVSREELPAGFGVLWDQLLDPGR